MKKILLLIVLSLVFGGAAQAAKVIHLDATRAISVIGDSMVDPADPNGTVDFIGEWLDQSGAGNDATTTETVALNPITYPSSYVSSGGFAGVNFTGGRNRMQVMTPAESDALLDFTGSATGGFTVFVAVADDPDETTHATWSHYIGNHAGQTFFMRHDSITGRLATKIGNTVFNEDDVMVNGDTTVQALSYNAVTGDASLRYLSSNGASGTLSGIQAAGDFSQGSYGVDIGNSAKNTGRYLEGLIGEIVVYDDVLSPEDYAYQFDVLTRKWVQSRAIAPKDGRAIPLGATSAQVEWVNLLPDTEDEDMYVDVWFGTDPESMSLEVDAGTNTTTTSVAVSGSVEDTYYWAIDTYVDGDPAVVDYDSDPNLLMLEGPVYSFSTSDDPFPDSVSSPGWSTWPNAAVPIEATVVDLGDSDVTVTFSCDDPNLLFDGENPKSVVIAGGGGIASTSASIDYDSPHLTVTITAEDAINVGVKATGTMAFRVFGNPCQAERLDRDGVALNPEDLVLSGYPDASSCTFDLEDFVRLASTWLVDYEITAPRTTRAIITADKAIYASGETIIASYANTAGLERDWIGIYPADEIINQDFLGNRIYLNGNLSGDAVFDTATLGLTLDPGMYKAKIFFNDSYAGKGTVFFEVQ